MANMSLLLTPIVPWSQHAKGVQFDENKQKAILIALAEPGMTKKEIAEEVFDRLAHYEDLE